MNLAGIGRYASPLYEEHEAFGRLVQRRDAADAAVADLYVEALQAVIASRRRRNVVGERLGHGAWLER
jgi:hypothetical protein